ncbi:alpha-L-fucosidase [Bacillus niameyensis]|uniref:alpha-L-fucosidase n=1 Tax=Bacillus niameyensis TaxID=1522308 RepID=UPI0007807EC1|nr:alpha-L-fucosidase [Bacillus niameyensis]
MKQNESITQDDKIVDGVHLSSDEKEWIKPNDPVLIERLEWFKDQKLGFMMHWGPHAQLGTFESWPLSDDAAEWSRKDVDWESDTDVFKKQYINLNKSFNPIRFQPEEWANLASEAGFKYFLFTTKHHDGFCLWDTKTTNYKSTDPTCPFHTHKYADIVKHSFNAFREKGLAISAYFSKADWYTPYYWERDKVFGHKTNRGPSYDPTQNPELWDKFVKFTHEQIMELITDYGRIDMLWLDAGQVNPNNHQDIRLGEVVAKARENQPWLLTADRTVGGPYENIITPEQTVPDKPIFVPWESCITMGTAFSYRYDDDYKPTRQLIHLLIEVISKGGNLALNVAPQPDGRISKNAIKRMKKMGEWLKKYGEAVYGTRMTTPYFMDHIGFTKKDNKVYSFYLYESEDSLVKKEIFIPYFERVNQVDVVGDVENLEYTQTDRGITVQLPELLLNEKAPYAHVFRLT